MDHQPEEWNVFSGEFTIVEGVRGMNKRMDTRWRAPVSTVAAGVILLAGLLVVSCGGRVELDEDFQKILTYSFGDSREPLTVIEDRVRDSFGNGEQRLALERQFAEVLRREEATYDCRDFACRQLRIMGTEESVDALYDLLLVPETADMARYALQENMSEDAGKALRKALGKTDGAVLVGVVNSIGERGDEQAVDDLGKLASGTGDVAAAAREALAKIRGQ